MLILEKYSFGVGDRFACQAKAQLQAMIDAEALGIDIVPVWNKSHREHSTIQTSPSSTRQAADRAVDILGWSKAYYCDADHIGLGNVDLFIDACDFYTLDVADFIGEPAPDDQTKAFVEKYKYLIGTLDIPGIEQRFEITQEAISAIAKNVLLAVKQAGKIYTRLVEKKGAGNFITEISMDETDQPQTPIELLFILAAIADEGIPAQTIAPKFTGRFNKGVDYVGDVEQFEKEFNEDLAVIRYAVRNFGLPANLKLSVHSGSDKFSIYAPMNRALRKFDAGLHVKTAGTTWLEELIGLAASGGGGLALAKEVYAVALKRFDELCGPYAAVIDIDQAALPSAETVAGWSSEQFVNVVTHNQACSDYDPNVRQLLHVGYKVAAELGGRYLNALRENKVVISAHVRENIFERHIKPIFGGLGSVS